MEDTLVDRGEINLSALPHIGEVVDEKYQIIREIARGGMGVVYEALDIVLNVKVAFKILQFQEASPIAIKRFEREIKACSQLLHPNIVKVYTGGIYRKSPYMIMDYIDGVPITKYIKEHDPAYGTSGKRNYNLCVKLIEQIANALEYIHQKNIYHRDIKPSNILVKKDGTPMLIDFGIVKFQQNQSQSLTKTNEIIGTCSYMSPEQVGGKQASLDHRSDIYSLGVVLYELLTEQNAFTGSMLQILNAIVTMYPPLPTKLRNDIPKALEEIVMTAIEKDRKYRYQTAQEFADALEEYRTNKPKIKSIHSKISSYRNSKNNVIFLQIGNLSQKESFLVMLIIILSISICLVFFLKQDKLSNTIEKSIAILNKEPQQQQENKPNNTTKNYNTNHSQKTQQQKTFNTEQMFSLAWKYYQEKKFKEALELFIKLGEQGHAESQFTIGTMYVEAKGTDRNIPIACEWYTKAANQGNFKAQWNLACTYYVGDKGVEKDIQKAIYWNQKAAKQGYAKAQYQLGILYYHGQGVKQDIEKAVYWFEKAGDQKFHEAKVALLEIVLKINYSPVKKIAPKVCMWFEELANQGNMYAQFELGVRYGWPIHDDLKIDRVKEFYWFEKAAMQGHIQAQYNIGVMYFKGEGVKQNLQKSSYWYEQAAQKGYYLAQYKLAEMYLHGQGVEKNLQKAIYWFQQSANHGYEDAKTMLEELQSNQ